MHCDVAQPALPLLGVLVCVSVGMAWRSWARTGRPTSRTLVASTVALVGLVLLVLLVAGRPVGCDVTDPADARRVVDGEPHVTPVDRPVTVEVIDRTSDGRTAGRIESRGWPRRALVNAVLCPPLSLPEQGSALYDLVRSDCIGVLGQAVAGDDGDVEVEIGVDAVVAASDSCGSIGGCVLLLADLESLQVATADFVLDPTS